MMSRTNALMNWTLALGMMAIGLKEASTARGQDIVQYWNDVLCTSAETVVTKHNPGVPTRAMAMMNGSIYDVFQAINRTHAPFKVNTSAPGADVDAAASQAAYLVLKDMYPEMLATLDQKLADKLATVPSGAAKTAGLALGAQVATTYITSHQNDGWDLPDNYNAPGGMGHWTTDPMVAPNIQKGWGSDWGSVDPWAIPNADAFDAATPFTIADLNTQRYTDAFNEVKDYGARVSPSRTPQQTATGLFWAYDRPGTGAPPVLFIENMVEIGSAIGNTPADNARMFAQASITLADSIIAAWDEKYEADLWRPITGIRAADDGNPNTIADPVWEYLGAPGGSPGLATDDFTPPFPAYVSGHATMGGAIFKTIELFYGTNDFAAADAMVGADAVDAQYAISSSEPGSGPARHYMRFTQVAPLGPGSEDSPEGENTMSRVYLGVHWRMDQEDGQALGRAVADYVAANFFQAVPEPSGLVLGAMAAGCFAAIRRRRGIG
jgi:hypothetical protein